MITDDKLKLAYDTYWHNCHELNSGSYKAMKAALEAVFAMQEKEEKPDLRPLSERLLDAAPNVYKELCDCDHWNVIANLKASDCVRCAKCLRVIAKKVEPEGNQEGWIEWNSEYIAEPDLADDVRVDVKNKHNIALNGSNLPKGIINWNNIKAYRLCKPNTVSPDAYIFNYSAKPLDMKLEVKYSDGTSERFPPDKVQYDIKGDVDVVSCGIVTESVKKKTLLETMDEIENYKGQPLPKKAFERREVYRRISEYLEQR